MKMAYEYVCGNEEDIRQNSVNLMNLIREYPAMQDRNSRDVESVTSIGNSPPSQYLEKSSFIFAPFFFTISRVQVA